MLSCRLKILDMGNTFYKFYHTTLLLGSAFVAAAIQPTAPPLGFNQTFQQSWALYSPYFAAADYVPPPVGCNVTQVNLLQRHGARYPTASTGEQLQKSVAKLQSADISSDPSLSFLTNFTYALGTDVLVPYGAAQSFDAGQAHFARYGSLINDAMLPFVRASSSERVVESALNWTAGNSGDVNGISSLSFAYASNQRYKPALSVILSESGNDTLDNSMCPNAGSSSNETTQWLSVFAPSIADRLNAAAPGANLTNSDILNIMSMCPYETVANEAPSPFCDLFSLEEFDSFGYYEDVKDYYGNGYGQQLGPVQGVGYVNELLARLTGQPVQDETQTNHTLDSSPATFPLNRTFYADFSHDNEMISIYSAIGLFLQPHALDPTQPDSERTWIDYKMVPFSGRMVTEKLECAGTLTGDYVRILVSDVVQPLAFCGDTGDGLCALRSFVESQQYARLDGEGDWELCSS
ncbi:histidine phosphatase superfamily [Hygrophoropsis aurantiaca]|uniref:Histidine phosphatase superfamily n=1 Tax=Hygrophoropsis aurantiaca TaxID=72124 RepID=A0ACB8A814_9AGAM|nr:histidine phosphatase superfamily [Hygrophoropsis aurantiaca]